VNTITYTPYESKVEECRKTGSETEVEALVKLSNLWGKQGWEFVAPLDFLTPSPAHVHLVQAPNGRLTVGYPLRSRRGWATVGPLLWCGRPLHAVCVASDTGGSDERAAS